MKVKAYYLSPVVSHRNLPKVQFMWVEAEQYSEFFRYNGKTRKFGDEFFRTREEAMSNAVKHMAMCLTAAKAKHSSLGRSLLNQQRTLLGLENGIRLWGERGDLLDTAEPSDLKLPWLKGIAGTIKRLESYVVREKSYIATVERNLEAYATKVAKLTSELNRLKTFQQEVNHGI